MQEDTKPKNDDVQDNEQKKPFTRSEYHGVITSYAGLVLSLIAIILSVITMYQSHIMQTREIVQILRAEDDGYYHFDGEKLFKNYQVTVANNSAIPVSVVEITVERDGEARTFEISDLSDILPLNMESNHTEMVTIPWNIDTSTEDAQKIRDVFSEETLKESDIVLSSKLSDLDSPIVIFDSNRPASEGHSLIIYDPNDTPSLNNGVISSSVLSPQDIRILSSQSTLSLAITLCTAKDNQYILTTQDMGAPEDTSESSWVVSCVTRAGLTVRDFIEAMHIAQKSQEQTKEEN